MLQNMTLSISICVIFVFVHVVELDWSYPSDVWSLACVIYELYTGRTLFEVMSSSIKIHIQNNNAP